MWKKSEMKFHASMFDDPHAAADVLEKHIWEVTKDATLRFVRHESPHIVFCRQVVDTDFMSHVNDAKVYETTKPFYPLLDYAKNSQDSNNDPLESIRRPTRDAPSGFEREDK
jgi:hypothetical protein